METETNTVVECLGPMPEGKADVVDRGIQRNMNHDRYHTSTGTRAALEAADRKAADANPVAQAPIGAAGAARLHDEITPAAHDEAQRDAHKEIVEDAAADVLAAALELAAAPRSAARLRLLRSAALKYGTLRNARPKVQPKPRKKGARK